MFNQKTRIISITNEKWKKTQASSTIGFGASFYKLIAQELLNVRLSRRTFVCLKHNWTIVKSEIS